MRRPRRTLIQQSRAKRSVEKASYHEIEGAGRSRVRRPFFGLSPDDETEIIALIDRGLERELRRSA